LTVTRNRRTIAFWQCRKTWMPGVPMETLGYVFAYVGGLTVLSCFILAVVRMFQMGEDGLAWTGILLFFLVAIGTLVAFVNGWRRNREWQLKNVMVVWSVAYGVTFLGLILNPALLK